MGLHGGSSNSSVPIAIGYSGGADGIQSKGRFCMNSRYGRGCIILMIAFALSVLVPMAQAKTCEECPQGDGCVVNTPAGDGCNTCTCGVYCKDGEWYRTDACACTLMTCYHDTKIENPYGEE